MSEELTKPSSVVPLDVIVASIKAALENASSTVYEEVVSTISSLMISLERPIDIIHRLHEGQMPLAIVKSAIDAGILNALAESEQPLSAGQLATKIGAASSLTGMCTSLLGFSTSAGLFPVSEVKDFVSQLVFFVIWLPKEWLRRSIRMSTLPTKRRKHLHNHHSMEVSIIRKFSMGTCAIRIYSNNSI